LNLKANAKINLGLRILRKRPDGFHDIVSLFQRVSLCDYLTIESSREVIYNGPELTEKTGDNLCCRAAREFQARFGFEKGAIMTLDKSIPSGAGLGGGSADAAAVLRGMAMLYSESLADRRLFEAGLALGSDVPFFLLDASAALVKGRGERLRPAEGLKKDTCIVILWPGYSISTRWAYNSYDETLTKSKNYIKIRFQKFLNREDEADVVWRGNDFEAAVFKTYHDLEQARNKLLETGVSYAALSGSGSALFGLYDDEASAQAAAAIWQPPWHCFVCRPY